MQTAEMLNSGNRPTIVVDAATTLKADLKLVRAGEIEREDLKRRLAAAKERLPRQFLGVFFEVYPQLKKFKSKVINVNAGRSLYPEIIAKFEEFAEWLDKYKSAMSMY